VKKSNTSLPWSQTGNAGNAGSAGKVRNDGTRSHKQSLTEHAQTVFPAIPAFAAFESLSD
jgi:hypothetical protein